MCLTYYIYPSSHVSFKKKKKKPDKWVLLFLFLQMKKLQWIRKLLYIYTMEYYSAIKMNAFESLLMRWVKQEPIIQNEVRQKEKHQYSILMHIHGI